VVRRLILGLVMVFAVGGALADARPATAANGTFAYGGDATAIPGTPGALQLRSVTSAADPFGFLSYTPTTPLTVAGLTLLSTDYDRTDDDCGGGSPRFSIRVSATQSIFVYIGPAPNFTGCPAGWQSTGNLLTSPDARFDLTQLGGPFYGTWAQALALAGPMNVQRVSLVVDAGWFFPDNEQTFQFRNVRVNTDTFNIYGPPTSIGQCQNGGWQLFTAPAFRNQGDCVSYVATGGRNPGRG
jgi:hypothetical protein